MASYHHGDLRAELLAVAAEAVAKEGVAGISLRKLARQIGVTHAAPRHHFGDKRGVITALAAQGYTHLAERLRSAGENFLEAGVAYFRFALEQPGHFAVMYQADLVDTTDEALISARAATRTALLAATAAHARTRGTTAQPGGSSDDYDFMPPLALLGWAAAHGLAHLASIGALGPAAKDQSIESLTELARRTLSHLGEA